MTASKISLFDCTLRDGANALPNGFTPELTEIILNGLLDNGIRTIEIGGALGLGGHSAAETMLDIDYLRIAQPFANRGNIGVFMDVQNYTAERVKTAIEHGMSFIRIGANAGEGYKCYEAIQAVKKAGLTCLFSLKKAYLLKPEELAKEAACLETCGLDGVTIMDSAGTMLPMEAESYARALSGAVSIPVAFHGHNNLGLATANALAAVKGGAATLDCDLLGLARSAGNIATESVCGILQRYGQLEEVNLVGLLTFMERELVPRLKQQGLSVAIQPVDTMLGLSGCHSHFLSAFREIAALYKVSVYTLIEQVSKIDRRAPSRELIETEAINLANSDSVQAK